MSRSFPEIVPLRQYFHDQPEVANVALEVEHAILTSHLVGRVPSGGRIAVTVGSRGIAGIAGIVRSAVSTLSHLGFRPFVVAAMGSHGGGTEAGQRSLLTELGVTEASVGCSIRSEMETVVLGTNSFGLPIHFDANAHDADGIVLLNRIKPHTSFRGDYESGLLKMLVVGLGKRQGAAQVHKLGLPGLVRLIPEVGRVLLQKTPVALGLAILENARERTARIVAVEPEEILEVEPRLLDESRTLMGRLPFNQIDVLVVGELGKNYSGTGLDPNVIGRQRVETMPDLDRPLVTRLVVLDLSPESRGNALGVGLADLITARLRDAIDPEPIRVNSFTSNFLTRSRIPLTLENDHAVLEAALDTCWRSRWEEARMAFIPNTLELEHLWATTPLAKGLDGVALVREGDPKPIPFDSAGRVDQPALFPQSTQGRRTAAKKA